ncbi:MULTISPECIES: PRD domain-containing protein [Lactobacillus]|uniref:PRD domain-containing protein n=1 Tax=Lactobacillus TaxID=1578 RepID=UPI0013142772|nr:MULTISPECIES: PRD domain-containing protein [Lactobacillus]
MKDIFKITQVLNNNAVFATNLKREEMILVRQGIGFNGRNKIIVDSPDIQVFSPQTEVEKERFEQFINEIPFEYMQFTIDTVNLAKSKLKLSFSNGLIFTLADHISFAVERYRKHADFDYMDNEEIKQFFPEIYKFSQKTVRSINKKFDVALNESEAVAITFHFVNSMIVDSHTNQKSITDTKQIFNITSDIMKIIESNYGGKIDRRSISYSRMIVHIRYLVTSILQNSSINDSAISKKQIEKLLNSYSDSKITKITKEIGDYLRKKLNYDLTEEDQLFLDIHLTRQRLKKETNNENKYQTNGG